MMSIGSARIRHSQRDHSEGKKDEKARRGVEWGREASICRFVSHQWLKRLVRTYRGQSIGMWTSNGL